MKFDDVPMDPCSSPIQGKWAEIEKVLNSDRRWKDQLFPFIADLFQSPSRGILLHANVCPTIRRAHAETRHIGLLFWILRRTLTRRRSMSSGHWTLRICSWRRVGLQSRLQYPKASRQGACGPLLGTRWILLSWRRSGCVWRHYLCRWRKKTLSVRCIELTLQWWWSIKCVIDHWSIALHDECRCMTIITWCVDATCWKLQHLKVTMNLGGNTCKGDQEHGRSFWRCCAKLQWLGIHRLLTTSFLGWCDVSRNFCWLWGRRYKKASDVFWTIVFSF